MLEKVKARIAEIESQLSALGTELNQKESELKAKKDQHEKLDKELKVLLEARKGLEEL